MFVVIFRARVRRFDEEIELVKALGMSGISKSQVSRLCTEIDERVGAFLSRPIEELRQRRPQ